MNKENDTCKAEELKFGNTAEDMSKSYENLINLWTSGVSQYHSLTLAYLTANSILMAAIGVILSSKYFYKSNLYLISMMFSLAGLIICIQMYIALGSLRSQNAYFERCLRILERRSYKYNIFTNLYKFRELGKILPREYDEEDFPPYAAVRFNREWWAQRIRILPVLFGMIYISVVIWVCLQKTNFQSVWFLILQITGILLILVVIISILVTYVKTRKCKCGEAKLNKFLYYLNSFYLLLWL